MQRQRASLRFSDSRSLEEAREGVSADGETTGGFALVAVDGLEDREGEAPAGFVEGQPEGQQGAPLPAGRAAGLREVPHPDAAVWSEDDGALHPMLELAHVAGPLVVEQAGHGRRLEGGLGAPVAAGVEVREVAREALDLVRAAVAEGGTSISTTRTASVGHQGLEVAVGGAEDPHVGREGLAAADTLEGPVLQEPQQLPLGLEGTDLVDASSAISTLPFTRRSAPVKAPRSWPKSSLSTSCPGSVVQSTVTKGPVCRGEFTWMARAKSVLPVPVSPLSSTIASVPAARPTRS